MAWIAPPPPLVTPRSQFHILPAGSRIFRIYDPTRFSATATAFRTFGPLLRFDHHRGIRRGDGREAAPDPERAVYYAAPTISSCLVEMFGDDRLLDFGERRLAVVRLTRDIRLLDLRGASAMRAGSITALAKAPDHRIAQAWSRYFYAEAVYQKADGLLYQNAHNDEEALALYERAIDALDCQESDTLRLNDPALRPIIQVIAEENLLFFAEAIVPLPDPS